MTLLAAALIVCGVFLLVMGAIGLLRFPDFYTRMHAAGKCDTLGIVLILIGLAAYEGLSLASAKMVLVAVFTATTSPTATHAIARSAFTHNLPRWTRKEDGAP